MNPEGTSTSLPHNTYEMNSQTYDVFTVQRAREDYNVSCLWDKPVPCSRLLAFLGKTKRSFCKTRISPPDLSSAGNSEWDKRQCIGQYYTCMLMYAGFLYWLCLSCNVAIKCVCEFWDVKNLHIGRDDTIPVWRATFPLYRLTVIDAMDEAQPTSAQNPVREGYSCQVFGYVLLKVLCLGDCKQCI